MINNSPGKPNASGVDLSKKEPNHDGIRLSHETIYAIDWVVRKWLKDEKLILNDTTEPDNLNLQDQTESTSNKPEKMSYEEWYVRKEAERALKEQLVLNAQ